MSAREWVQQLDVRPGQPWPLLPWEPGHPLQREAIDTAKEAWRHTVYGGVFPLSQVRKALEESFGGENEEDYGGARQLGETSVFAITVDDRGVLLDGTTAFSSCAWATGRIHDPGPADPSWLDGFEDAEKAWTEALALLTNHHIPYGEPSVTSVPPGTASRIDDTTFGPADTGSAPTSAHGWRAIVREILGGAAVGALGALIGDFGAGIVAGALTPIGRRIVQNVQETRTARSGPNATTASASSPTHIPPVSTPDTDGDQDASTTPAAESPSRPVSLPDLVAFAAHVAEMCGVTGLLSPASIRIHSHRVRRRKDGTLPDADPAFLNSLLPKDLERVSESAEAGYGDALSAYLADGRTVRHQDRVDVRRAPQTVLESVTPDELPLGRWPSRNDRPLALSQQFSVNRIVAQLGPASGLFSVNGPPGTGKTTMLRDLIASVVVERAKELASLENPDKAFGGRITWQRDGQNLSVRKPWANLTGHEIVIASSNNGAVENITAELPSLSALEGAWPEEASYFLDQAVALLDGAPAWGAIAAPLGRADKRKEFLARYWWGDKPEDDLRLRGRTPSRSAAPRNHRGSTKKRAKQPGMQYVLQALEKGTPLLDPPARKRFPQEETAQPLPVSAGTTAVAGWAEAKTAFVRALRTAETMRAERSLVWSSLRDMDSLLSRLGEAERAEAQTRSRHEESVERASRALAELEAAQGESHIARSLLREHREGHRPGRWPSFMGRAFREWQSVENQLQTRSEWADAAVLLCQEAFTVAERARSQAEAAHREAQNETAYAARGLRAARQALARARSDWPQHLPEGWEDLTDEQRELSAPWSDAAFCAARTRVFLAALNLHKAFAVSQAAAIRGNLRHLKETFAGVVPGDAALAVWQTLFLILPVVSTTFASCGRLFAPLGREAMGWLLVDEAGQATPQAAVGALWRARRAVLVGDPLQLEPVVPLPVSVQERLRSSFGVMDEWVPSKTSAQRVADRVNRWGTQVEHRRADGERESVWVGSPLRVHRRCERTIFALSNDIAYDGLMVYGTKEEPFPGPRCAECVRTGREGCRACVYPLSCWVDVTPGETSGKWVLEEGEALAGVLSRLNGEWRVGLDRIRVLSPFREVVEGCSRTVRGMRLEAHDKEVATFVSQNIGTVHTMQGKQSDVVILVLGTHPRQGARAREWAAAAPNLLNVAVSRAKRRLFVIGHRESWAREPYFALLADSARLPRHPWPGHGGSHSGRL